MTGEEVYEVWRPSSSPWAAWVKPVLFSFMDRASAALDARSRHYWSIPCNSDTAMVADLPGSEGVRAGLALAHAGYRPIPVYNTCPFPLYAADPDPNEILSITTVDRVQTAVDVESIMQAILESTDLLNRYNLPNDAPPVFLIDANRKGAGRPDHWCFDNRSFISGGDFPSAAFLKRHGIFQMIILRNDLDIEPDLLQVLLAWQREGIALAFQRPWQTWRPEPRKIKPPLMLLRVWHWLIRLFGYPARGGDGFGEWSRPSGG